MEVSRKVNEQYKCMKILIARVQVKKSQRYLAKSTIDSPNLKILGKISRSGDGGCLCLWYFQWCESQV